MEQHKGRYPKYWFCDKLINPFGKVEENSVSSPKKENNDVYRKYYESSEMIFFAQLERSYQSSVYNNQTFFIKTEPSIKSSVNLKDDWNAQQPTMKCKTSNLAPCELFSLYFWMSLRFRQFFPRALYT